MRQSFAILSFLASAAFAQESTVEFFFPGGYEGTDPVASVVTVNPSTTVLNLACPTGTDSNDCGFGSGFEYKIVSTTIYEASMSEEGFIMTFSCDHNIKADQMTCGVSIGGDNANDPGTTSAVLSGTDIAFLTATVTAGQELLGAAATGASTGAAPTVTTGASTRAVRTFAPSLTTAASTGLETTGTVSVTGLASGASGAEPPAATTNAAYRYGVEGSALLALAGAAAVNMW
ncbi:hypothetical protein K505DRAFT_269385 [Melanomma pulvis-pyrius CBS 109.77]|uniref:GPI anchored protein n=1 Tax=Melanomma pulvis-pyrius CBS 109.77 TaxID=1314802 RepID=A0A6A6XLR8_9PLEO|nr:hypothetical protein K505DRAFT_269385 [Melanomma pulvis-pyrius CBS 109.77]